MPKVLLVEDNELNRDMLSRRLVRRGFEVAVAVDGQQAVEMAERELPDIILMDMSLPVLDGWGATRLLKTGESTRSIPVIALTAHAMAGDRDRVFEVGCDDYDTKPVDLSRLLDKVDRLLVGKPKPRAKEPLTAESLAHLQHELKTSFNHILGHTEILLEDAEEYGLGEIAPALGEIHSNGRTLLDRIQRTLVQDKGVSAAQLQALESEIERLGQASEALTGKVREADVKEALADLERVSSAIRLLHSLVRQVSGEAGSELVQAAAGAETGPPESSPNAAVGVTGRLLIVEDDVANRNLLRRRLARHGYAVEVAEDGPAALEKISQSQYDLVLLDQLMPGMSGVDLLRLLRATYSPSELPVIMVTAVDQSQTVIEALDQGANDYVSKPVDMPVVMARIQAQLARSKADRHTKLSDPLTGLSNRLLLSVRLTDAIARQSGLGATGLGATGLGATHLAVLLLDLDGFKVVNDSFGHGAGDQFLVAVAERLTNTIAQCNLTSRATVARIGGDEFVILIEHIDNPDQPAAVAQAILECLALPVCIHGMQVTVSGSIGIALGAAQGVTPENLLRNADLAMYRAKELGKNRWQNFDPSLHERVQARMAIAIDLRHAIERRELLAVYQPKVNLRTHAIVGFEVLLRWRHPERGLLPPSDFISVAEETGLIIPIGEWIIAEACRQLEVWQARFAVDPPLSMNVNLSVKQLRDPNLVGHIQKSLTESHIPPETLKLELTESTVLSEVESAQEVLASIKALRVGLKLDDFGTGYSSLSYLRTFHFDSLKIDRTFVERMGSDPECRAIVETIIHLADAFRMNVVAEGIENELQLADLIGLGCETGQGYYFSEPLEAGLAEKLLESSSQSDLIMSLDSGRSSPAS